MLPSSDDHDGVDVEALAYLVLVIIMRAFGGAFTSVMVTPLGLRAAQISTII